jgi:hypothetical protein
MTKEMKLAQELTQVKAAMRETEAQLLRLSEERTRILKAMAQTVLDDIKAGKWPGLRLANE